jgi:hypothetical protein
MAEKRSCGSDSMRDGTGGVAALNARSVLSLGFVGLDDVSMGIPGTFSVIDRLGDASTVVGRVVCCCDRGRGLIWVGVVMVMVVVVMQQCC